MNVEIEKVAVTGKLERCIICVSQLKQKMSSYLFEPNTEDLFEERQGLLDRLQNLQIRFENKMHELLQQKEILPEQQEEISSYFKETNSILDLVEHYEQELSC